ncbi:hypothetical protein DMUE_2462 [Dictyocoela muelleri]|nr:hypothetical protein DMUE_2462 [Dictyocoela muelleri]
MISDYQTCNPLISHVIDNTTSETFKPETNRINCNGQYNFIISKNRIIPDNENLLKDILHYEIVELPISLSFEVTKDNQNPQNNNEFNYTSHEYSNPDLKTFNDNSAVNNIGRDTTAELLNDFREEMNGIERNFMNKLSKNSNGQLNYKENPKIYFTETGIRYTDDVMNMDQKNIIDERKVNDKNGKNDVKSDVKNGDANEKRKSKMNGKKDSKSVKKREKSKNGAASLLSSSMIIWYCLILLI